MGIEQHLLTPFIERARRVRVDRLSVGLGYTAVRTSDGGLGLSYTYFETKQSCLAGTDGCNGEGRPALELLELLVDKNPLRRSMALATLNALNHARALELPEDPHNRQLFGRLGIGAGSRVAMVGLFKPLMRRLHAMGAVVEVVDRARGIGDEDALHARLGGWAQVLLLTATTLLNATAEVILSHVGEDVRTVILGPSTPLVPEAFTRLPVHMLAGTVPLDGKSIFRAVRHGAGTPVLQRFGRKVLVPVT